MSTVSGRIAARVLVALMLFMIASRGGATVFIVPTDEELVAKSEAIITGVVVASTFDEPVPGTIETVYSVSVRRSLKGTIAERSTIQVRSPGGAFGGRFEIVQSAAHFAIGDDVLLFLTPHRGVWTPMDLTLGKFRFASSTGGYGLLLRDAEDIAGWDRDGKVHKEKVRLEAEFLDFIRAQVAGRRDSIDYQREAEEVLAPPVNTPAEKFDVAVNSLKPANTYAVSLYTCDGTRFPGRWPTSVMNSGVVFQKNSAHDLDGPGDGGTAAIAAGLASWTNDCGSAINITAGAETAAVKNSTDGINTILFDDPSPSVVPGTWTGSGTIAITFSGGEDTHTFDSTTFVNLVDSDIVFQNGYHDAEPSLDDGMTHEIGHAIGFRHADKHFLVSCPTPCATPCAAETACQPAAEECATNLTAIMTTSVSGALNTVLQVWDKNAANALYPDNACVTPPDPPVDVVATALTGTSVQVTWTASDGATEYEVYRSSGGGTFNKIPGSDTAGTTFTDTTASANTAYRYTVTARNTGGSSTFGDIDLATTVIFTDPILTNASVKLVHFTELLTAVNAVRALAGLTPNSFNPPAPALGLTIEGQHVIQLRFILNDGLAAVPAPVPPSYTDTIVPGVTPIRAVHLLELRNAVK